MKAIVVHQVDLLSLSNEKAGAFLENIRDKFREKFNKESEIGFIVVPVRNQGSRTYVYSLVDGVLEEVKPVIIEHQKLLNVHKDESPESVVEYVKM